MSCWYNNAAPSGDIVVSTRIRLARNINGYPFPARMSGEQRDEVNAKIKAAVSKENKFRLNYIDMKDVPENERFSMVDVKFSTPPS